jgi:sulfur carrier protein
MKSPLGLHITMMVNIRVGRDEQRIELPDRATVELALHRLALLPDAYIVVRGNIPIPMDEPLLDGETIKAIKVASGG